MLGVLRLIRDFVVFVVRFQVCLWRGPAPRHTCPSPLLMVGSFSALCARSRSRLPASSVSCLVSSRLRSCSGVGRAGGLASPLVTVLGFGGDLTLGAKAACVVSRRALSWFFPSFVRDDLCCFRFFLKKKCCFLNVWRPALKNQRVARSHFRRTVGVDLWT